jgi:hypothetical protein
MARSIGLVLGLVGSSWLLACQPKIGDDCVGSIDCSQQGDRLCDTSQPDGYCTAFNCQPDNCPEEAVCVGFGLELDPACVQESYDPRFPRFERTFCLLACEEDSDCRDGYRCAPPSDRRAASIDVDNELAGSKVCFPAADTAPDAAATTPCVR